MTIEYMLTTVDNPYNPFTQFDEWYGFDEGAGYHSSGLLARVISTSDDLSEADQSVAISDAIDEVVRENVLGIFRKIAEDGSTTTQTSVELASLNP
jgi:hypothetical protein